MMKKNKKAYFFIGIGLILFLISLLLLTVTKQSDNTTIVQHINTDLNVDENGKKIFDNKIDAYKSELMDSLNKRNKRDINLSNFGNISGLDDFKNQNNDSISEQEKKDSLEIVKELNLKQKTRKKIVYKKKSNSKSYYNNSRKFSNNVISNEDKTNKINSADDWLKQQSEIEYRKQSKINKPVKNDKEIVISVLGDQNIKNGNRMKFLTNQSFYIKGHLIPKNTIIYGFANLQKNRIFITIKKIKNFNVNYQVIDANDNYPGIYIENENLLDESKDEVIDDEMNKLDNTGILNTAKKLFKKKKRERKVFVLNNYKLKLYSNED